MSEENMFAMPAPAVEEEADAPILLGAPPEETAFIGDVNEAPEESTDAAVLVMPVESVEEDDEADIPVSTSSEPSPMQQWNAEWQETLKQRKDEENSRKAEIIETAKADMEKFNAERELKRETKMAANRSEEQEKLEAIEADLENDNSWQRVCKMIELSHDNKSDAEDVKRMRDIMIGLKNEPARATALSS